MAGHSFIPQVEVLAATDRGRRRRWTAEEKLRIVEESSAKPRMASATARRMRDFAILADTVAARSARRDAGRRGGSGGFRGGYRHGCADAARECGAFDAESLGLRARGDRAGERPWSATRSARNNGGWPDVARQDHATGTIGGRFGRRARRAIDRSGSPARSG